MNDHKYPKSETKRDGKCCTIFKLDRHYLHLSCNLQSVVLHGLDIEARHGVGNSQSLSLLPQSSNVRVALKSRQEVLERLAKLLLNPEADLDALVDQIRNLDKVGLVEAPRCQCGSSDADTAGSEGASVTSDCVLVEGDVSHVEELLGLGAGEAEGSQVEQDQVVLCAVGDELVAELPQAVSKCHAVLLDLLLVGLKLRLLGLLQSHGESSDGVVVGATLERREDGLVDSSLKVEGLASVGLVLTEEDDARARSAQRLVGGGGHDVGVLEGPGSLTSSDKTRDVGHVDHEVRADLVANGAEALVVPLAGICRTSSNDETGLEEHGVLLEFVIVDVASSLVEPVRQRLEVDLRTACIRTASETR
jgi:hypothetical protein